MQVAGSADLIFATCSVTMGTLDFTEIKWTNMMGDIVTNIIGFTEQHPTLNLRFIPLRTSDAGTYTCHTAVADNDVELLGEEQFNVSVKSEY